MSAHNRYFTSDKKEQLKNYVVACGHSDVMAYDIVDLIIYSDVHSIPVPNDIIHYRFAWSLIKCGYEYLPENIWRDTIHGVSISDIAKCLNYLLNPYIEYWNR